MIQWRVTQAGEKQWLGGDGNWYSTEPMAAAAQRPSTQAPPIYRREAAAPSTGSVGGFLALVSGALMIAGAFLPWVSFTIGLERLTRNSLQLGANSSFSIDGVLLLIFGTIVAMIGVARMTGGRMPRWLQGSAIAPGVVAIGICLNRYFPIHTNAIHATQALQRGGVVGSASVGYGIWVAAAGGAFAIIGGLILRSR